MTLSATGPKPQAVLRGKMGNEKGKHYGNGVRPEGKLSGK